jgi:hypothetical protein
MSDLDFYPAPVQPGRSILCWLILLAHAGLFALFIYAYPSLSDTVAMLTSNLARVVILVWGGILVLHVVMITVWDAIAGVRDNRKRRAEVREYRRMKNRQKLINQVTNAIDIDQTPDEDPTLDSLSDTSPSTG